MRERERKIEKDNVRAIRNLSASQAGSTDNEMVRKRQRPTKGIQNRGFTDLNIDELRKCSEKENGGGREQR